MYCKNCGFNLNKNAKFCPKCGSKVNNSFNYETINEQKNQSANVQQSKGELLGTLSLIFGIISIVLSFFLSIFIIPFAVAGLILGIINKIQKGKKFIGIILNSVAILIVIVLLVIFIINNDIIDDLYEEFKYNTSSNYVAGDYDCVGVDSSTDEYLVTLHLNKDYTFLYGPYGDLENNYVMGTYTYEDENKTNESNDYKYYMLTLSGKKEDFIVNGISSDSDFSTQMEFGITTLDEKKQGVIIFVSTYNMYYCYEN